MRWTASDLAVDASEIQSGRIARYLPASRIARGDKESNWLPTPPGQFNLTLRNYYPKEVAYDGTYKVPPVRKIQ